MTGRSLPVELDGPHAVRTHGLVKSWGGVRAVDDLALQVPEGSCYLLIGPNGAGKTTTFRILLGLLAPDAGTVEVGGARVRPGSAVSRAMAGYVPEAHDAPYRWLRCRDLLAQHARYYPTWDHAYAAHLSRLLEIRPAQKFGKLSKGQARRIQLLLALAHRPPLLLLDEPTDGLDPVARDVVQTVLAEHMADTPTTVLVSTHLVYEMERFADHVGVLREGRLVAQVTRPELHARLKRYELDVPETWAPEGLDDLQLVRRNGTARLRRWTVWGEEAAVVPRLATAGATVRQVQTLSLDEAALALLGGGGSGPDAATVHSAALEVSHV